MALAPVAVGALEPHNLCKSANPRLWPTGLVPRLFRAQHCATLFVQVCLRIAGEDRGQSAKFAVALGPNGYAVITHQLVGHSACKPLAMNDILKRCFGLCVEILLKHRRVFAHLVPVNGIDIE